MNLVFTVTVEVNYKQLLSFDELEDKEYFCLAVVYDGSALSTIDFSTAISQRLTDTHYLTDLLGVGRILPMPFRKKKLIYRCTLTTMQRED